MIFETNGHCSHYSPPEGFGNNDVLLMVSLSYVRMSRIEAPDTHERGSVRCDNERESSLRYFSIYKVPEMGTVIAEESLS